MNLPKDIETQIVGYLNLEFGEAPEDSESLKESELRYEGEFMLDGTPTHFWWFPCTSEQCWATVEPMDESYCIGMTTESPDGLERA